MEGKELTARERGKVGPGAQSDNDNQGLAMMPFAGGAAMLSKRFACAAMNLSSISAS